MYQQYKRILVAVDGSKGAEKAFQKAMYIAKRNNASLCLVHIIDTRAFSSVAHYDVRIADKATDYANELLNRYQEEAEKVGGFPVETHIGYGSPKPGIIKIAEDIFHPDLIMCGATGLNAVERIFVGSVTEYTVRHSPCDVLVVRENEPEPNSQEENTKES